MRVSPYPAISTSTWKSSKLDGEKGTHVADRTLMYLLPHKKVENYSE